ncbi:ZIP family metal transporter [Oceanithermus sp.]
MEHLLAYHPAWLAFLAGLFTWGMTALGAATVFLKREMPRTWLDAMLGFAAGVMIAASVWSLLLPAIDLAESGGQPGWLPAAVGFLLGGGFLRLVDRYLPHLHLFEPDEAAEGVSTTWHRTTLLIIAITLHNLPEGLAVGVAFGAAHVLGGGEQAAALLAGAVTLAIGIGLQNLPEGAAVSMPLRREGLSPKRSFFFGQLSALVEPVGAVLGATAVLVVQPLLPYALAFAAGAMIFVVVEEIIPESQSSGNGDVATFGVMIGFALMMVLDVALG